SLKQQVVFNRVDIGNGQGIATKAPAAEPPPGPTQIPMERACLIISATIRKEDGEPLISITEISYSARLTYSSGTSSPLKRSLSPSITSWVNHEVGVCPSGTSAIGMRSWVCSSHKASYDSTRSAIHKVLSQPSGTMWSHSS